VRCTYAMLSGPASFLNCLAASTNQEFSMSPTVPPISIVMMSGFSCWAISFHHAFISSVMWGNICMVLPRYLPSRSFAMTLLNIFPDVRFQSDLQVIPRNLS